MKHIPITSECRPRRRTSPQATALALLAACSAAAAAPTELLVNGSFDDILAGWTTPAVLATWIPYQHPEGNVNLHPNIGGYSGTLLSQPLNVGGIAGQSVSGSVTLGTPWAQGDGQTVTVWLEYLDDTGARQRHNLIQPANAAVPVGGQQAFTGDFTFPANATKLVELGISKSGWGEFHADNLSLTSDTLAPGPVPRLASVNPSAVAYGGVFVIHGSDFASPTAPIIRLNGTPQGLTVTSWTDTTITVEAAMPATSGDLEVFVGGSGAPQRRALQITSPHCAIAMPATQFRTIAGLPAQILVETQFHNGFTAPGGIQFAVAKDGTPVAVTPTPAVTGNGGCFITLPTAGLTPGHNWFSIKPQGGGFTGADSFFDIFLEVAASGEFLITGSPVTSHTATKQGKTQFFLQLLGADGEPLVTASPIAWTTMNPAVCEVYTDPQWGGTELLIHDSGTATVTGTTPDGRSYSLPVTVNLPATPKILAFHAENPVMVNSGSQDAKNKILAQLDVPMSGVSVGYPTEFNLSNSVWGPQNKSISWDFATDPGLAPGTYLFNLTSNSMQRSTKVTVVNAAGTGMVSGRVVNLGGGGGGHHMSLMGTLEFYDAGGNKVTPGAGDEDVRIDQFGTDAYRVAHLDPGSYRVRWVPEMGGAPQWWPNADSFANAQPVTVTAGQETAGIHFFMAAPRPTPPAIAAMPTYDPAASTFRITVLTEEGFLYQLQRSDTMADGSWFNVGNAAWGDGKPATLEDTTAGGGKAFYRVLAQPNMH